MNISKTGMKVVFIIVLLLILLPLALLLLVQFAPPQEAPAQDEAGIADSTEDKSAAVKTHQARRENRATKQETTVIEPEPAPVWEIGAISTDPTRKTKQATPYEPGTVPGDSGIVPQRVGPPDDLDRGHMSPSVDDDPWGGAVLPPMTPEQMRGIGGVRRIDPNDPFFQREIPNPFAE